jgi:hypothetical protein
VNIKELREQLTDEMVKDILAQFNVEPVEEDEEKIIFPTCCHNLEGGSPKLWYYKSTKLFRCFTECQASFDIFTLLQKMYILRGQPITLRQAIQICDLDANLSSISDEQLNSFDDIRYMQTLNNTSISDVENMNFKTYDKQILRKFSFDYMGLMPWIQEGMSIETLQKFSIKYDSFQQAILIPNFDYDGNLIGLRARYLKPEDVLRGKYRPYYDIATKTLYNHPTGRTFYGIYENHKNIERKKIAVIFEGEKSVILYGSIYGNDQNIALATLGQNITKDHITYLIKMQVCHVILAYDTDYEDYEQLEEVKKKYLEKAKILSQYFNVSVLFDYDFDLPYKSSPIDGGKEIFEKMLANRRIV